MSTPRSIIPCLRAIRQECDLSSSLRPLKFRRLYSSSSPTRTSTHLLPVERHNDRRPCSLISQRHPRIQKPEQLLRSHPPSHHFSVSTASRATTVTANPRTDDDGNEMLIDITSRAATRLNEIMTKDSNPSLALRVTVESGGCHGFQYLMSLTSTSSISSDDDTVFEASDGTGAKVVMDEPSLGLLKGSKVDYTMELIGSQFKIVGNPAASSSCGCGTSFDIKV
ncbi:MAG: hypothetical protein Q9190_005064 [Brigantiaea leucoxantha]